MRAFALALLIGSTLALGACSMPGAPDDAARLESTAGERAAPAPAPATSAEADLPPTPGGGRSAPGRPPEAPLEAPPMSDPLPPERVPDASAANPPALDRSCRTSADCAVKNVGNCCGAMPACVNTNARTDPAAVQAQCARDGISGVCGFKDVTACTCVAGTCQDSDGAVAR
jgi:hypothetical protein